MQFMTASIPSPEVRRALAFSLVAVLSGVVAPAQVAQSESPPPSETVPDDAAVLATAAVNIGAGLYVAPLDPRDLPTHPTDRALAQPETAERAAERTLLWTTLRNQVLDAGAAMTARTREHCKAGAGVQLGWDMARTEILPRWIAEIEATNDAILKFDCSDVESDLARRRAWARCRAVAGHNRGNTPEDAPAAFDADLWLLDRAREQMPCVQWLQPLFDPVLDCPEQWLGLRSVFASETTALRAQQVRSRLDATKRQAREPGRLVGDAPVESAMLASEKRLLRWREHNERYFALIEALAVQAGRTADAALLRCRYLHAENRLLLGERAVHAALLTETARHAGTAHPERAEEINAALVRELAEYSRSTAALVDAMLKSDRRSRRWLAGARDSTDVVIEAIEHAQRLGEARQRLMDRQLNAGLAWIADEPDSVLAMQLRDLQASAEMDSWGQWRQLLQFGRDWLTLEQVEVPPSGDSPTVVEPPAAEPSATKPSKEQPSKEQPSKEQPSKEQP